MPYDTIACEWQSINTAGMSTSGATLISHADTVEVEAGSLPSTGDSALVLRTPQMTYYFSPDEAQALEFAIKAVRNQLHPVIEEAPDADSLV